MTPKKLVIVSLAAVLALGLALAAYFYWPKQTAQKPEKEGGDVLIDSVNQAVLPGIGSNPMENKPDINPAEQGNPFNNVKTNPFE